MADGSNERPCRRTRRDTHFDILADGAELAIRAILDESRALPKVAKPESRDLYSSFLDEERINARGVDRSSIGSRRSKPRLNQRTVSAHRPTAASWRGGFYAIFVDNDPGDPERYVTMLEQGGLSLPDESYYREEHFAAIREAFVAHVNECSDSLA